MSRIFQTMLIGASISLTALAAPAAFAQTTQPAVAAQMKPIMVKMQINQAQMPELVKIMHSNHNNCFIEDLDPGDNSSMLMVCGVAPVKTSFAP